MTNSCFFNRFFLLSLCFTILNTLYSFSQTIENDTIKTSNLTDTIAKDTLTSKPIDRTSPQAIESKIDYAAKDSIIYFIKKQIVKLYGDSKLDYQEINLTAANMTIDLENKEIFATFTKDSLNNIIGKPIFKEGESSFTALTIKYNFETRKGYITQIFSEVNEMFFHGNEVKRMPDESIYIKHGSFTTCPSPEPHFKVQFSRAKLVPDDKVVTGPVWLVVERVPLPLGLPFGFFPNKKGRQSGILMPTYGESANRGFYLENFGYYFGLNDFVDFAIRGDIYSRGSWAIKNATNYKKRYKYDGQFNINYSFNKLGIPETPSYRTQRDFFVVWRHNQDPKAHPKRRFNADVRAGSSNYNTFNPSNAMDYLSSNFSSSITYATTFGNNVNFSVNMRHSQNTQTKKIDMSLPEISLSTNRIFPFRRKKPVGKFRWYENINLNYVMNARNTYSAPDSLFFQNFNFRNLNNGINHQIPISWSQKILKHFNLTTTFNYNERWYFNSIDKFWNPTDSLVEIDTLFGFKSNRDFNISSRLQTRIFGMYLIPVGPITALRHVLTPSISYTYRPNFGSDFWGYYGEYFIPGVDEPVRYSIFENGIFGHSPYGRSGNFRFDLANNIEIKVKRPGNIEDPTRKIVLLENLNLSMNYDISKDSLNWSKLFLDARTRLFDNLHINYRAVFDPYVVDTLGRNLNKFEFDVNNRLFRTSNTEWGTSLNWSINNSTFNKNAAKTESNQTSTTQTNQSEFAIPWNINLAYTLQYLKSHEEHVHESQRLKLIQTISLNGDIKLTPNWKVGVLTNYDITNQNFSYSSVNIQRDLHCWEIIFNWIPFGFRKSYNFTLRAKAPLLQDLKINKKTDWRDFM